MEKLINEKLDKLDTKLDTVIENQHNMDLKFTKKVGRNTFICSGVIWFLCAVVSVGVAFLFSLM